MEILSCSSASCCNVINLRGASVHKSSGSSQPKLPGSRKRILCAKIDCKLGSSGYSNLDHFCTKNHDQHEGSRSLPAFERFSNVHPKALGDSYDGYVLDGKEGVGDTSERRDLITRILIPGLPDDSNDDSGARISSCFWEWKPKLTVHYEKAGSENVNSPPVLFLPGFGVGSFHYEKQLKDLGHDFRVWAVDFLGQGMSLPCEDPAPQSKEELDSERKDFSWGFGDETEPWANELVYSIDLWRDQVRYFIEQVNLFLFFFVIAALVWSGMIDNYCFSFSSIQNRFL